MTVAVSVWPHEKLTNCWDNQPNRNRANERPNQTARRKRESHTSARTQASLQHSSSAVHSAGQPASTTQHCDTRRTTAHTTHNRTQHTDAASHYSTRQLRLSTSTPTQLSSPLRSLARWPARSRQLVSRPVVKLHASSSPPRQPANQHPPLVTAHSGTRTAQHSIPVPCLSSTCSVQLTFRVLHSWCVAVCAQAV